MTDGENALFQNINPKSATAKLSASKRFRRRPFDFMIWPCVSGRGPSCRIRLVLLLVLMVVLELLLALMLEAVASRGLGGLIVFPSRRLGALPRRLRGDL